MNVDRFQGWFTCALGLSEFGLLNGEKFDPLSDETPISWDFIENDYTKIFFLYQKIIVETITSLHLTV